MTTERPDRSARRRLWPILPVLLVVTAFWSDRSAQRSLQATPHLISNDQHPFDPDWLEVLSVTRRKCVGCHRKLPDQIDLTTYDAIVNYQNDLGERLVVPGKPTESLLWRSVAWNVDARVDSDLPDSPMMPEETSQWLTRGQIDAMARWIRNGALEYRLPSTCSPRPLLEIDFPSARECKACHPRQYEQWARSMHHYAQHSPINEAFNLTLQERTSGTLGTFCTRCHTPIGTALGENGLRRNVHRSRQSMEGVTCVVCHRAKEPFYKSNTRHYIQPGSLIEGCMYGPFESTVDPLQAASHESKHAHHLTSSAFCGSCHDVTTPQGLRLEEAFSEWQNSPAAAKGISCQHCHMGPDPGVPIPKDQRPIGRAAEVPGVDPELIPLRPLSDHSFAGPDYSLLPDTEFPEKLDWMYETDYRDPSRLTPHQQKTLQDLRRHNRRQLKIADALRRRLLRNGAQLHVQAPAAATCGQKIQIRAEVENTFGGHSYPTGFTAERQFWVQITLYDPAGRVAFASGDLDSNGDLRDAHSHDVETSKIRSDRYLLNFQNKFTALTQRGTDRTVILSVNRHLAPINFIRPATGVAASFGRVPSFRIAKGSLPPLQTMGQSYPVRLPPRPGDYLLDVKLNYRHLPPNLLDKIGTPHLKHLLEIVVVDQHRQLIRVGEAHRMPWPSQLE